METIAFDYKKERSFISLKYGFDLDETSSSILFVLRQEQATFFATQKIKLDEAISKINTSNNSLQVDASSPRQQAFWFGMGKWGFALIFAISIASCLYIYHMSEEKQTMKATVLLNWYREYYNASQSGSKKNLADFLKSNPLPE